MFIFLIDTASTTCGSSANLSTACSTAAWTEDLCRAFITTQSTAVRITDSTTIFRLESMARRASPKSRKTSSSRRARYRRSARLLYLSSLANYMDWVGRIPEAWRLSGTSLSVRPSNVSSRSALGISAVTFRSAASNKWNALRRILTMGAALDAVAIWHPSLSIRSWLPIMGMSAPFSHLLEFIVQIRRKKW